MHVLRQQQVASVAHTQAGLQTLRSPPFIRLTSLSRASPQPCTGEAYTAQVWQIHKWRDASLRDWALTLCCRLLLRVLTWKNVRGGCLLLTGGGEAGTGVTGHLSGALESYCRLSFQMCC